MSRASYCFVAAQRHAETREWKERRVDPGVLALAAEKMRQEQWSPQQISRRFAPREARGASATKRSTATFKPTSGPEGIFTGTCGTAADRIASGAERTGIVAAASRTR